ncbi:hypothetical protein [Paenibacillus agricola]|uniref:Uncharacterized protein n=1 Tax=Paenibacillus agricola TaxID=2716264 RepID=A0ABX0IZS4_9BACL|nr:hypothetical protein [Paenibacillus agricola]NHN29497.1 hypothetical protein [Paenibacillus agricola]
MIVLNHNHEKLPVMIENLAEYLDYDDSKALLQALNNMEFEEVVELQQSLETILMYLIADTIVH